MQAQRSQKSAVHRPEFFDRIWNNVKRLIDLRLRIKSAEGESKASASTLIRIAHRP